MHEMGEMKRAQELWVDGVSVQKLRENHETIQQLTSQLQQMQEQMNSMNDSCDFQDVESISSGRLSDVSSQSAVIPSSRSLLSRDKRLPLDTWNQSGLQEKRVGKSIFFVRFTQRLFSKNSIWRRAKKPRSSPWNLKDEDYSHKWRQTKSRHNSNADICDKAVDYEFSNTGGITSELDGRTAETANIGIAIRQVP